ncbi:MAG: aminotransferase class V-fold PLP-dependent enzyme [Alphaproteobacteria bacterium]|nr:aminotransferase class V-fold PLP-dependent enzyme [Alphaproteobacteria bacterium]
MRFLNHGSFGGTPRSVLEAQARWRDRMEAQPIRYFMRERPGAVRAAAARLADYVGSDAEDLVFVDNATTGVNAVLRSLRFNAGDRILCLSHVYNAVRNTLAFVCARSCAQLVEVVVPTPLDDVELLLHGLQQALKRPARLAVLDHITSFSGLVLPIERMVRMCQEAGVPVLVDGAHAPGQEPLDLRALDADYYVGNCHKWIWAPKGCALLRVAPRAQAGLHPTTISHGYEQGFAAEFDFTGTADVTPWLSIDAALDFHASLGDARVRAYNRALVRAARRCLLEVLGEEPAGSEDALGFMATVCLPRSFGPGTKLAAKRVHDLLWDEHRIEVPVDAFDERLWLRISAQVYNELEDYEALAEVLADCMR